MAKKKIILTLSRLFPIVCSQKGEPTNFEELLKKGIKKHTIRINFDQWQHNAEHIASGKYYLSLRQWSARPYHSPQVEIARIDTPIKVAHIEMTYHPDDGYISALVDGNIVDVAELAKNDGISLQTFKEWFFSKAIKEKRYDVFKGVLIYLTNFQY